MVHQIILDYTEEGFTKPLQHYCYADAIGASEIAPGHLKLVQ